MAIEKKSTYSKVFAYIFNNFKEIEVKNEVLNEKMNHLQ